MGLLLTNYGAELVSTILLPVIQIMVIIVAVSILILVRKATKKLGVEIDEKTASCITKTVELVVGSVNQKLTNEYKKLSTNGKLTEEQKRKIFNSTKEIILASLTTEELEYIYNKFEDSDLYLETLIENCVSYSKTDSSNFREYNELLNEYQNIPVDEEESQNDEEVIMEQTDDNENLDIDVKSVVEDIPEPPIDDEEE